MESRSERTTNALMLIIGIPLGIALMIWTVWITVTAFIGGQAPFFFLEFDGINLIRGLFWLIIVDPIVLTVAYWIFMLLMLPLNGPAMGAFALADQELIEGNAKWAHNHRLALEKEQIGFLFFVGFVELFQISEA